MAQVGRPKNIPTPDLMYSYFKKYVESTKSTPFLLHDFVGKDADEVERKKERCLSYEGFDNWLYDNDIISDVSDYFENKEGRYSEFVHICSRIKRKIRQDQIEGGMAGIYNPSITQRLNGLVDKSEQKQIIEQPMFDDDDKD